MPKRNCHNIDHARTLFRRVLCNPAVEALARETGFTQRRARVASASSVTWALLLALGGQLTRYISDVLRTLNAQEGTTLRYKPFWNRLARRGFPAFTKALFEQLCSSLTTRVLERQARSVTGRFSDILMDDGCSFAVADGLADIFPGRFTKVKPAAVELHGHMSLLTGNFKRVSLAPDKEAERQFVPAAEALPANSLTLRDRGYIDTKYFAALEQRETPAYLICRARRDINPIIVNVLSGLRSRAARKWEGKRVKQLQSKKLKQHLDLLVEFKLSAKRSLRLRLVIRYVPEKRSWTWLLTNVPDDVDADAISTLYRLRWHIELAFKDWKSDASLRAFQSEQRYIVEGLIWASLCAAFLKRAIANWAQIITGTRVSMRLAAMSGAQLMPLLARWARSRFSRSRLEEILDFMLNNVLITHPERLPRSPMAAVGLKPRVPRQRLRLTTPTQRRSKFAYANFERPTRREGGRLGYNL
ncbi:MAG: IS4 family transposase [bacterium]|nr:IS4 family transposase [bacterium]